MCAERDDRPPAVALSSSGEDDTGDGRSFRDWVRVSLLRVSVVEVVFVEVDVVEVPDIKC